MISPSNTNTGLTRRYRGMRSGDLEHLYPTGERNYVRIAAADHLSAVVQVEIGQAAAADAPVRDLGPRGHVHGGVRGRYARGGARLGANVVGAAPWDPQARRFTGLTRTIARRNADAVLIAGAMPPRVGAFLRDLRAGLGRDVALIANDGFAPGDTSLRLPAGRPQPACTSPRTGFRTASCRHVERAGSAGFLAARGGEPTPSLSAAYAAQATRSCSTRSRVPTAPVRR